MINCQSLVKSFGSNKVIKDVSLILSSGKITSLIGKNGAGKSTLIGLMVGYYKLDSGSIQKDSYSVMPDADSMYPSWTGYEFLQFISKIKKVNFKVAINLADELGIKDKLKAKINGYSFGMKKKLSFIQCALGDYETYIFDEPTSGVDVPSSLKMMEILERLKENGAAILLTSHNIDELERISNYIYVLEDGRISNEGEVADIINQSQKIIYHLVSQNVDDIYRESILTPYLKDRQVNLLELEFSNETQALKVIKKLIQIYDIKEFYQKKNTLIDSVYKKR